MGKRKTLTRKLDQAVSKLVRSQGKCARCGNEEYSKLQCCHIHSRTYRSVRWFLDNLICLCASCHRWGHRNPTLFTEFVQSYLGEARYQQLKKVATPISKWSIPELEALLAGIQEALERIGDDYM